MWDRPDTEFLRSQDLSWERVPDGDFGSGGGVRKVLSADAAAGAATTLVRFRSRQRGVLPAGADAYVLEGTGTVNGRRYGPGHYLHVPPGAAIDLKPLGARTTLYLGAFGPAALVDDDGGGEPVRHEDVEALPWSAPGWNGDTPLEPGVSLKWLRRDDRGIVYFSAKLPGWKSPQLECHPNSEESFKVYGDTLLGAAGVMTPGSYFFHRPGLWHGPLYTRTGTASFIRASADTSTEYREPAAEDSVPALSRHSYADLPHPALTP